jgi:hypothetical protein
VRDYVLKERVSPLSWSGGAVKTKVNARNKAADVKPNFNFIRESLDQVGDAVSGRFTASVTAHDNDVRHGFGRGKKIVNG